MASAPPRLPRAMDEALKTMRAHTDPVELRLAMRTLIVYLVNVVEHGDVRRFRTINPHNRVYQQSVGLVPGTGALLGACGFEMDFGNFVLAEHVGTDMCALAVTALRNALREADLLVSGLNASTSAALVGLVVEHACYGLQLQENFRQYLDAKYGKASSWTLSIEPTDVFVKLSYHDGHEYKCRANVLGMYNHDDAAWRWAWDMPQASAWRRCGALRAADWLRSYGKKHGVDELKRAYLRHTPAIVGHTLGSTCLGLVSELGFVAYYRLMYYEAGFVILTFEDDDVTQNMQRTMSHVVKAFVTYAAMVQAGSHVDALAFHLRRNGYGCEQSPDGLTLRCGSYVFSFNDQGKLQRIAEQLGADDAETPTSGGAGAGAGGADGTAPTSPPPVGAAQPQQPRMGSAVFGSMASDDDEPRLSAPVAAAEQMSISSAKLPSKPSLSRRSRIDAPPVRRLGSRTGLLAAAASADSLDRLQEHDDESSATGGAGSGTGSAAMAAPPPPPPRPPHVPRAGAQYVAVAGAHDDDDNVNNNDDDNTDSMA